MCVIERHQAVQCGPEQQAGLPFSFDIPVRAFAVVRVGEGFDDGAEQFLSRAVGRKGTDVFRHAPTEQGAVLTRMANTPVHVCGASGNQVF
ncbi:hypothetical protein AX769_21705 (plasmid) [Frondihabitans sp. PAMC 28766]|nr:hypothetical protein AX769_21705 [Frondihabitans sp. PAMC 28766]